MVLAVVALDRHIDHGEAVHPTAGHRLLDAGLYRTHVVTRDRAADDGVLEDEALTTGKRRDAQVDDGELTMAAALLLQLPFGGRRPVDGFPVGHAHVGGVDVDAELACHALERHGDMGFAEAAEHGLPSLLDTLHPQRRVFRLQPTERVAHFVVVGLGVGHDGNAVLGRGPARADHLHRGALGGKRVAGVGVAQLGHRCDVAGGDLGGGQLLLAAKHEQGVQAFLATVRAVQQAVVGAHGAGQHLEQRELPDERVGDGLEDVGERLAVGDCGDGYHLVAGGDRCRALGGRRAEVADEVGQAIDAHAGDGGTQQHGELEAVEHLLGECAFELGDGGHIAGEVALELGVVARHDLLQQRVVHRVLLGLDRRGEGRGVVLTTGLVLECGLREHVGDAMQAAGFAQGQFQRRDAGAEGHAQLLEHALEAGAVLVLLVDEDHPRKAEGGSLAPQPFGLHFDAFHRAHHEHGEIGDRQRGIHLAVEVEVAGRVEQVDLVCVAVVGGPLEGRQRERQRHVPLDALRLGVEQAGAIVDPAGTGYRTGTDQQRLCQGGLAGTAVAHQGDVADAIGRVALHCASQRSNTRDVAWGREYPPSGVALQGPWTLLPSYLRLRAGGSGVAGAGDLNRLGVRVAGAGTSQRAQEENRTPDLRITSALLYRLSYLGAGSNASGRP